MKMKLFGESGSKQISGLEEEVNTWLVRHPDINIIEIKQSACGGSFAQTLLHISVWYEESQTT
ncbi:MAG: hypothetical protein PF588_07705 [Candidatus Kapabacteria bacterium]|jgi:hypothetical protein|nr:hypothetical protein [Candidatus Kapabacteria bacterium]